MNPTARTLPTSRATTTATMNPTWPGTSFPNITLRFSRGSTNVVTAWQTTPPMSETSDKLISISSSRSLCWRRPLTTGGIDERAELHGVGDDDRGGRARVGGGAYCFRRGGLAQYRLQPGALHRRARPGAHLRVRRLRGSSGTPAAFHRRPGPCQRGHIGCLYGGPVRVVLTARPGRGCAARGSPDRPLRQPQYNGHRRLRKAENPPARQRRRL